PSSARRRPSRGAARTCRRFRAARSAAAAWSPRARRTKRRARARRARRARSTCFSWSFSSRGWDAYYAPARAGTQDSGSGRCEDKRTDIEGRGQENAAKRNAEPVAFAEESVGQERQQTQREKEPRLEQEGAVHEGQVPVDRAEQQDPVAVAGIEPD